MLRLQHKSVRNRLNLWVKLALFSFIGHVAALGMLFFVYRGSMPDLALTVRAAQLNSTIDVVWVSQVPRGQVRNGKNALRAPSLDKARDRHGERKKNSPAAVRKSKPESKKSGPKTELKTEVEEKKVGKKNKPAVKKEIKKKPEPVKKVEKKPEIKKPEPEKILKPEKKEEIIESSIDTQIADQPEVEDIDLSCEISGSYRELEALQQFQELQQEISRTWRPPVGIAPTVSCQIAVTFDWEGKLIHMETVKPSGILMFDVSSRNAVSAMEAPKFVRGKTFTITFKP